MVINLSDGDLGVVGEPDGVGGWLMVNVKKLVRAVEQASGRYSSISGDVANQGSAFGEIVKEVRIGLKLSQEAFCDRYDVPLANLRNWEQPGRKVTPDHAARLLIEMIKVDPERTASIVKKAREVRIQREGESRDFVSKKVSA